MSHALTGRIGGSSQDKHEAGRPRRGPTRRISPVAGIPSGVQVEEIPIEEIDFDDTEFEFRVTPTFQDLVGDISRNGQQFPVVLRRTEGTGKFQIVSGFRRCRAIRALGWPSVRAIVRGDLDDDAAYRLSFMENDKRKGLTALDKAHAVCRLRLKGKTDGEIKALYGMSQRSLERSAYLSNVPDVLKEAILRGRIRTTHCLVLMKFYKQMSGELDLEKWMHRIEQGDLTTRKLNGLLAACCGKTRRRSNPVEIRDGGRVRLFPMVYDPERLSLEDRKVIRDRLKEALSLIELDISNSGQ